MQYIKYSIRHGIQDERLAWLLDYLERVAWWDIKFIKEYKEIALHNISKDTKTTIRISEVTWVAMYTFYEINPHYTVFFRDMKEEIFYQTYKSIIPAARDYSKK